MKQRLGIGTFGGTIMMTRREDGSLVPAPAVELTTLIPELAARADIMGHEIANVGSPSVTFSHVRTALEWAASCGADGIVLTHGTDTLEETAFALDLLWDRKVPLVVTGAMRSADALGADGPANLYAAAIGALDPQLAELGVVCIINDEIHLAARVRKTHTFAMQAFYSPGFGPIGRIEEGAVELAWTPTSAAPPPLAVPQEDAWIAVLGAGISDEGQSLRAVVEAGAQGVVIDGVGAGHVSAPAADVVSWALERVPVVVASRTGGGRTGRSTYAYKGAEVDLIERGAVMAGHLTAAKARILLWALAGADREQIRAEFARRG